MWDYLDLHRTAIGAVIVLIVIQIVNKTTKLKTLRDSPGAITIKHGAAIKFFTIATLIVGVGLTAFFGPALIVGISAGREDVRVFLTALTLLTIFCVVLPALAAIAIFGTTYRLTADSITLRRIWFRNITIRWDYVDLIRWTGEEFIVSGANGVMIKVPESVDGLKDFAEVITNNVPYEKWEKAEPMLNRLLKEQ